jgi:hypothetical protein
MQTHLDLDTGISESPTSEALVLTADLKIMNNLVGSDLEDADSHLSKTLGIKLFRFKSIVAEAMGEFKSAVTFQNDVVMYPKIQNQTTVNFVAKSQALLRLGSLNLRLGNKVEAMNAAESASVLAMSALERRKVEGSDEKLDAVMCDTITQLGDLLQVANRSLH